MASRLMPGLERRLKAVNPMTKNFIASAANELNKRAIAFNIGKLQDVRSSLTGGRRAARTIFDRRTIFEKYAFHVGGRKELQFNIGIEDISDVKELRFGVAFSLELNRNLRTIDPLVPKIKRFNEFLHLDPDRYADLRMWYWQGKSRSLDFSPPFPITEKVVTENTFIFLGQRQLISEVDYDAILLVFDRLLPLYKYIESDVAAPANSVPEQTRFVFRPGCPVRSTWATASLTQRLLDIKLRHNELQVALHRRLVKLYGEENVGVENVIGISSKIDVAARTGNGLWIYEIKTANSARLCIREAVGQLLEYSLWPGAPMITKLVIVGEAPLDSDAKMYLQRINERFPLPMSYEQIIID